MQIKYNSLLVKRSELATVAACVPEWEVPLLRALHGHAEVEVTGEVLKTVESARSAADEYVRLDQRYGNVILKDGSQGEPFVQLCYGPFAIGQAALDQAMKKATLSPVGG